ncbi:hypothetical protein CBS101457_002491 [Exobasidium rhododendri]|nr:hypothetical protein CBS101457_002491 [Exobasidium rhododendri]
MPAAWIVWGRPSRNRQLTEVLGEVLGASILAEEAGAATLGCLAFPRQDEVSLTPPRGSIGAAYLAAYILDRDVRTDRKADFHTVIEALKRGGGSSETSSSSAEGEDDFEVHTPRQSHLHLGEVFEVEDIMRPVSTVRDSTHPGRLRSLTTSMHRSQSFLSQVQRKRSSSTAAVSYLPISGSALVTPQGDRSTPGTLLATLTSPQTSPRPSLSPHNAGMLDIATETQTVRQRELAEVARMDQDIWEFYGAMLEEHIRLADMTDRIGTTLNL